MRIAARGWMLLAGALGLVALAGYWLPQAPLAWQAARPLQPWRWFTAAAVHWTPLHLGANLAGLALLAWLGAAARLPAAAAAAWLAAWPLTHAVLAWVPGPASYGGLSGVLHAGAVVAGVFMLHEARATGRSTLVGLGVLAGVALKLWLEAPWQAPLQHDTGWGFPVAVIAHATGALAGLACAVAALALSRESA